jgi:lipopolysaccharide/colanic/teichoic acid biosynthesis glycosyltransferase
VRENAPARTLLYPVAKRIEDKTLSFALLALLSPLFAVAAGAVALGELRDRRDRGRLLYHEPRVSGGRTFDLLKFRTVRVGVLEGAHGEPHVRLLEADEANLTWAGQRVLKPWYLDELPQLWNVLRGDMSLVGPRPWPRSMVTAQAARGAPYRTEVMAGWTGPAQLEKGAVDTSKYLDLDLAYVERLRRSSGVRVVCFDISILVKTIKVLARGEGLAN